MQEINPQIEPSWKTLLMEDFKADYFSSLKSFLIEEKRNYTIYPPGPLIFNAFNKTPVDEVKVVILGQDPYHGHGQAHGLCFSVPDGIPLPPSLKNIFKEIENDTGLLMPATGNLEGWAKQGILLLNATLTVRAHYAGSHQKKGWEKFTDSAISKLSETKSHLIFLLWGNYAQDKTNIINTDKHYILKSPHPSPLSAHRGFFGCKHFTETNKILKQLDQEEIIWNKL